MKKKFLAILLAAIMVMTLVPTVAFATTPTDITAVDVTLTTDFANKTMTITPKSGDETMYKHSNSSFDIVVFDEGENPVYVYSYKDESGSWSSVEDGKIDESKVDLTDMAFILWNIRLATTSGDFSFSETSLTVNVNGKTFEKLEIDDQDDARSTGYYVDDPEYLDLFIKQDLPKVPKAKIKGVIDAADFAYELIIPSETILTEDDHEDVLLGGNGKVSIEVTKHGANNIDVFYKVDLENGNLTDGADTTIDATYAYSGSATGTFTTLVDDTTEVTVYTGGEVVDSFVNVTADSAQWDAAPVGDYNATVVFNFEQKTKCSVDPEVYSSLLKVVAIEGNDVYFAMYEYNDDAFVLKKNKCESNTKNELFEYFGLTEYAIGDYLHADMETPDIVKCTAPEELGITDIVFSVEVADKGYYVVPAGTNYSISDGVLTIDLDEDLTFGVEDYNWTLNEEVAETSGTITDGAAFVGASAN